MVQPDIVCMQKSLQKESTILINENWSRDCYFWKLFDYVIVECSVTPLPQHLRMIVDPLIFLPRIVLIPWSSSKNYLDSIKISFANVSTSTGWVIVAVVIAILPCGSRAGSRHPRVRWELFPELTVNKSALQFQALFYGHDSEWVSVLTVLWLSSSSWRS